MYTAHVICPHCGRQQDIPVYRPVPKMAVACRSCRKPFALTGGMLLAKAESLD